jgi:class 3 adenylate cyclase
VDVARPGNVLVDETVAGALTPLHGEVQRVHSVRRLRGFDKVRAFVVHPPQPVLAADGE